MAQDLRQTGASVKAADDHPTSSLGKALLVEGLRKGYGYQPVLWDLTLSVEWGECVALFGANGAGKTTLLKVLSAQARADAGIIRIAQRDARTHSPAVARLVGLVSHRHLLYEDMTGEENLRFYGRMFGLEKLQERISEVLQMVGMEKRAGQRVRALYNGQQKRLAIARAVLHRPRILLLDEPESGLDVEAVEMLGGLISRWTGDGGSVLMATHSLEKGLEWADRVTILSQGAIAYTEPREYLDLEAFRGIYRHALELAE